MTVLNYVNTTSYPDDYTYSHTKFSRGRYLWFNRRRVLIEVPVILLVVRMVNASVDWYEQAVAIKSYDECCPSK